MAWAAICQVTDQPTLDNFSVTGVMAGVGPPAPTLSATGNTNTVLLNWTQSAGATTYNILRGTSATNLTQLTSVTGTAGTNTYTDGTAVNGMQYYYEVVPVHTGVGGASDLVGTASNEVNIIPATQTPAQITGLALSLAPGSVTARWSPVNFATGYQIWRAPVINGAVGTYAQIGSTTSATTFTDNSTTDPTSAPSSPNIYSYYIIATNTAGPGPASAAVQANFLNGAEDFIYNNPYWKSGTQAVNAQVTGGINLSIPTHLKPSPPLMPTAQVRNRSMAPRLTQPTSPTSLPASWW